MVAEKEQKQTFSDVLAQLVAQGIQGDENITKLLEPIKPQPIDEKEYKKALLVSSISSLLLGLSGALAGKAAGVPGPYVGMMSAKAAAGGPLGAATYISDLQKEQQTKAEQYGELARTLATQQMTTRRALATKALGELSDIYQRELEQQQKLAERQAAIQQLKDFYQREYGLDEATALNWASVAVEKPQIIGSHLTHTRNVAQQQRELWEMAYNHLLNQLKEANKYWNSDIMWYEGKEELKPGDKTRQAHLISILDDYNSLRRQAQALGYDLKLEAIPVEFEDDKGIVHKQWGLRVVLVNPGEGGIDSRIMTMLPSAQPQRREVTAGESQDVWSMMWGGVKKAAQRGYETFTGRKFVEPSKPAPASWYETAELRAAPGMGFTPIGAPVINPEQSRKVLNDIIDAVNRGASLSAFKAEVDMAARGERYPINQATGEPIKDLDWKWILNNLILYERQLGGE